MSARLITGYGRFDHYGRLDHITVALRDELHWLSVLQRIRYKVALFVFKCLHDYSPDYLRDFCIPLSSLGLHRVLRSVDHGDIIQHRLRTHIGERSFQFSASAVWNSLLALIRDNSLTLDRFKTVLKTHYLVLLILVIYKVIDCVSH